MWHGLWGEELVLMTSARLHLCLCVQLTDHWRFHCVSQVADTSPAEQLPKAKAACRAVQLDCFCWAAPGTLSENL